MRPPTSADIHAATSEVIGPGYEPQTTGGQYAKTVGEFLPGSLTGPGGLARKAITFGLIPGVTSETAGQATEGTDLEPWARAAGGLLGGLGASATLAPKVAQTAKQATRQAAVEAAERISFGGGAMRESW
jgi:hypothetical protein